MSPAVAYALGVLTVIAFAYVAVGVALAVQAIGSRPSKVRHNAPPDKLTYHGWFFWAMIASSPTSWPIVMILFRLDDWWARRKWNAMTPEQRSAEWKRVRG